MSTEEAIKRLNLMIEIGQEENNTALKIAVSGLRQLMKERRNETDYDGDK